MTNIIRKILAAALAWASFALPAHAQSSPGWTYGYVPTPAQWNAAFAGKQDFVGSAFLPLSGGTMTGRLTTSTPNASGSGFNLPQGTSPSAPNNGDLWTTSAGLFARINGMTWSLTPGDVTLFPTKAAASLATIPAGVSVITTLGYAAAGDNGGADYVRTASTGATSYRFQSADGQWWTLNQTQVTPEMFGCFGGGADCTAALQVMSTWMTTIAPIGVVYNGKPGASYLVWSNAIVTPSPSFIFDLNVSGGKNTFNFNGSKFVTDNLFASGVRLMFYLENGHSATFNDPSWQQTAYTTPLDSTKGIFFISMAASVSGPYPGNVIINNATIDGGILGISCALSPTGTMTEPQVGRIQVNNYKASNVYYPLSFASCGDNVTVRGAVFSNVGRAYFPYNVHQHDIEIESDGGGPFDQLLLKVYADPTLSVARRGLQDIHVKFRDTARINATASATIAALEFQQFVANPTISGAANNGSGLVRLTVNSTANMATGQTWYVGDVVGTVGAVVNTLSFVVTVVDGTHVDLQGTTFSGSYTSGGFLSVPAHMKNITVDLDIDNTNGNGQPIAFLTRKHYSSGAAQTTGSGYVIDNYKVRGTIRNYNSGIPALDVFANTGGIGGSIGIWTGDYITNFELSDLKITGSNTSVIMDLTNGFLGNFVMRDVYCSSAVTTTVTTPGNPNFRPQNVSCGTIVDRQAVANFSPFANNFLTGIVDGVVSSAQPSVSNLSGLGTGVATALGIAVGNAGAFVTFNGALGTPSSGVITNLTGTCTACNINGTVGATTPAAGTFTTLTANTSVTATLLKSATTITIQINGTTQTGLISTAGKWLIGLNTTVGSGPRFAINDNTAGTIPNSTITNSFTMAGADDNSVGIVLQGWSNSFAFISPTITTQRARGTAASMTKVLSGDTLYQSFWQGCYGAGTCTYGTNSGAAIIVKTTEDWNDSTHNGTRIDFYATATASGSFSANASIQNSVMAGTTTDGSVGQFIMNEATYLMRNKTAWTNGAGAQTGTLTNAPAAGNPTKWIAVDDNGTSRKIPAW